MQKNIECGFLNFFYSQKLTVTYQYMVVDTVQKSFSFTIYYVPAREQITDMFGVKNNDYIGSD